MWGELRVEGVGDGDGDGDGDGIVREQGRGITCRGV